MAPISAGRLALTLSTIRRTFAPVEDVRAAITDRLITQDGEFFALNQNSVYVLVLNHDVADFSIMLLQNGDLLTDQDDKPIITQQLVS